jgi:hypothetical protein
MQPYKGYFIEGSALMVHRLNLNAWLGNGGGLKESKYFAGIK